MDTKAADGKTTLLHYIVGVVERSQPELLGVAHELRAVHQACRATLATVDSELSDLLASLSALHAQLHDADADADADSRDPADPFHPKLSPFAERADRECAELRALDAEMRKAYAAVLAMFGEEGAGKLAPGPEEFFPIFRAFLQSFEVSTVIDGTLFVMFYVVHVPYYHTTNYPTTLLPYYHTPNIPPTIY